MSVVKFELKKEHILLLKNLKWSVDKNNVVVGLENQGDEIAPPFGSNSIYEAIDLILNGKPSDFDPFNTDKPTLYTLEQQAEWDKLYSELPTALDIILYNGSFELGLYKTRSYLREWVKIKK